MSPGCDIRTTTMTNYKPSDLFIGVFEFFGILLPGAAFMFLLDSPIALAFEKVVPRRSPRPREREREQTRKLGPILLSAKSRVNPYFPRRTCQCPVHEIGCLSLESKWCARSRQRLRIVSKTSLIRAETGWKPILQYYMKHL
jgi:hypothetical protein